MNICALARALERLNDHPASLLGRVNQSIVTGGSGFASTTGLSAARFQRAREATFPQRRYSTAAGVCESALKNHISSESAAATPLELSQQQMQTLLHIALATITHLFGPPTRYLAGVEDSRNPAKIVYPLPSLLFTGLLMFLCHLAARRQIALKFRDNAPSAANFARLFGVASAPHGDTLNHVFKAGFPIPGFGT